MIPEELRAAENRRVRRLVEKTVRACALAIDDATGKVGDTRDMQAAMAMACLDHLADAVIHAHALDEGRAGLMLEMHAAAVGKMLADRYGLKPS